MNISRRRLYLALCMIVGVAITLLVNALTPLQPDWLLALAVPELPDVNTSPLLLPESQAMQSPINPPGPGGGGPGVSTPTPTPEPDLEMSMAEFYEATNDYAAAGFCTEKSEVAVAPIGDYSTYFPVTANYYRDIPDNGFGVAGADHGGDGRGECPGTNDMLSLGMPHSLSYHWNFRYAPDDPDFSTHYNEVQMVYNPVVTDSVVTTSLTSFVQAYSNTVEVWILGNEPDRSEGGPSAMCPDAYAKNYHGIRDLILTTTDYPTTTKIAVAGISQNPNISCPVYRRDENGDLILDDDDKPIVDYYEYESGSRESYINAMLTSYAEEFEEPMPIDIWTTHQYPVSQTTNTGYMDSVVIPDWVATLKSFSRFIREFSDTGYYSESPYITTPIWLTEYGYHVFGQGDRRTVDPAVQHFVEQSTIELQSLSGIEKIDYSFWFMAHSNHTAYRCAGAISYSGFLFEQIESTWGTSSAPKTPLSITSDSITISCEGDCTFSNNGQESGLPENEMWDHYTLVYFKTPPKDNTFIYRVSEVSEGTITDTITLTLCITITYTPSTTMSDYNFWLVRQRPEFDGQNTQFKLSPVGKTYVTATMIIP